MMVDFKVCNLSLKQKKTISHLIVLQDILKKLEPVIMEQSHFFEDKEKVATNAMSKEEIADLLKSFQAVDHLMKTMKTNLDHLFEDSHYIQKNLICFYHEC